MALMKILTFPDPRLREVAQPVTVFDAALKQLVSDMAETMYAAPGVGLAATQVGVAHQLVLVDPHAGNADSPGPEVYINAQILESRGDISFEEGCLSLPDFAEEVKRKSYVKVRAQDVEGSWFERELEGYHAVILQHELDHLNGVLAVDRVSRLKRSLYTKRRTRQAREENVAQV